MTVKEGIIELNTNFQKSYHDSDGAFFSHVAPGMLNEMEAFMNKVVGDNKGLQTTVLKTGKL